MKTLILSISFGLALALSSVIAQDYGTLIFNHRISTGMTFANVIAAWGNPVKVDRSVTSYGVTEYWFYNDDYMVVFENGRVSSFYQFNQSGR